MKKFGFTLIEILASLVIMSVFSTIALSSLTNVVDDARFNQTQREMEQIRAALVGETQRLETGLRRNYGYLGDVGALPTSAQGLAALSANPSGVSAWTLNSTYGMGAGWKGPYIQNTTDQDFLKDGWGNNYVYANPVGGPATITSYGSDGAAGGSGYAQDITLNIPNTVTTGKVLGYVVAAQGDVVGADQVPYSSAAQAVIYYPNGSGGFTSSVFNVSVTSSGRYTFSSLPLGYAAVKIFIPSSASPTQTIGPTIVEVNKAATAATPIAQDTSTIYGTSSACNASQNFSIVSSSYSKDNTARTVRFDIRYPQDFSWYGTFYNEQEGGASLATMVLTNMSTNSSYVYASSNGQIRSSTGSGSWTGIATNTSATLSTIALSSNVTYRLTFSYSSANWTSDQSVYYYQIGCKFLRAHPGM